MKHYNKTHHDLFIREVALSQIKNKENKRYVLHFTRLVLKIVLKMNRDESKIGAYNVQDLIQTGMEGLVEAWGWVDWDKIDGSENPNKTLVNFLSSNISGKIKRQLLKEATGVAIPESFYRKTIAEKIADSLFGNWMYSFKADDFAPGTLYRYADIIEYDPSRSSSHLNDILNDKLTTMMFKYLNDKERDIIRWSYGLDGEKLSSYEIGDILKMNANAVRKAQSRAIAKLRNNECEVILKDFL